MNSSLNSNDAINEENIIALVGNPNVGKSTVFNALTGLKQHTGNWPGKTVSNAVGNFSYCGDTYTLIDLPGTYSLFSSSPEEEITADYIFSSKANTIIMVADATCLERNLNLVLQILELTSNCILCVNLIDQAKKKKIYIDTVRLSNILGIPVVKTNATNRKSLIDIKDEIKNHFTVENNSHYILKYDDAIEQAINNLCKLPEVNSRAIAVKLLCNENCTIHFFESPKIRKTVEIEREKLNNLGITESELNDRIACSIIKESEKIASQCVTYKAKNKVSRDLKFDRVLTSKIWGIPIMLGLLGFIFYLSIIGANYPSEALAMLFDKAENYISNFLLFIHISPWLYKIILDGIYKTLANVISVMLPPMAIFFPLFTILENLGYLPRVAFNLDGIFKKCHTNGKQCLTMCMGLGCNAVGVTGARIIDSPRERLLAIITNSLVPCNGRFPTLITISSIFIGASITGRIKYLIPTLAVLTIVTLGILATFGVSFVLSKTLLKGKPSQFVLELPPYRKPKIFEIIYRSIFDRTLFVLGRAVAVAIPAGAIVWLTANIHINGISILSYCANFLNPFAMAIGLDGYILISFILGIPANEIVMPILLMGYASAGNMADGLSLTAIQNLLIENGWSTITAINFMLFTLFHFPCATTLLTIHKETKSIRWTLISFAIPTIIGIILCFVITQVSRVFI